MRARCLLLVGLALLVGVIAAGCGARSPAPSDIVVENRHDSGVVATLRFGDTAMSGGDLLQPGQTTTKPGWTGEPPERAEMALSVYRAGETDFQGGKTSRRTSSVPVKAAVPAHFAGGVFWFIIEPDLRLRLVVLTRDQWQQLEQARKRPE